MSEIIRQEIAWLGTRWSWFEQGLGPNMVLLHGGGGTGRAFSSQIRHFSADYRVVAPDLPGFGRSERPSEIQTVRDIAPALLSWLAGIRVDRMVLAGNSMGGRVALTAASLAPERVSHLILLAAVGVNLPDVPLGDPLAFDPAQFASKMVYDPEKFRRITPYRSLEDARELSAGRKMYAQYQGAASIIADPEVDLTTLTMPILLLWGRHDPIIPLAYGEALKARLKNATLVVLEDVGHLPHMESPEATNQAIATFLENHSTP